MKRGRVVFYNIFRFIVDEKMQSCSKFCFIVA